MLTLSDPDQSPIRSGQAPGDAIRETLALAEAVDRGAPHVVAPSKNDDTVSVRAT